ncbi:MAG: terminase large subunit [bacterium]|nr:terminase large subunit [bacterium]MDE0352167.1 terminase large subunit [bacterium]
MTLRRELLSYLGGLAVSQGRFTGEPLQVFPWERRFVGGLLRPGVLSAALTVARGNGKTTILSGIASATLDGPLVVPRGETVIVASSFEQARIAFEHVLAFMGDQLRDKRRWKVWDTAQQARIEDRRTGARVRCIGSDPRRAHGLAPTLVLADEPAQWPPATGERMVAALRTAAGKQPLSRFVALGTKPDDPEHWFARFLDGGADYVQVHAARRTDPPGWKRTWQKANPSLRYLPDLEAAIRAEYRAALRDPALMASFEALRLNWGTPDTAAEVLVSADLWRQIEGDAEMAGPCVWGVDLGSSEAQSAVAAYWPRTGALAVVAAFPTVPSLEERGRRDGVGGLYRQCWREGTLLTLGRQSSDVGALVAEALRRFGRPRVVVADRWRRVQLLEALEDAKVPRAEVVTRGMGFKDGGEDVSRFVRACADGQVVPSRSLLMRSALSVARTQTDAAGNRKMTKAKRRARDDCAVAAVLAVAEGRRRAAVAEPRPLRSAVV